MGEAGKLAAGSLDFDDREWRFEGRPSRDARHAGIEADMAAQLARVQEMERNGELEPIPEVSATIH
jgi:hypothetical protein